MNEFNFEEMNEILNKNKKENEDNKFKVAQFKKDFVSIVLFYSPKVNTYSSILNKILYFIGIVCIILKINLTFFIDGNLTCYSFGLLLFSSLLSGYFIFKSIQSLLKIRNLKNQNTYSVLVWFLIFYSIFNNKWIENIYLYLFLNTLSFSVIFMFFIDKINLKLILNKMEILNKNKIISKEQINDKNLTFIYSIFTLLKDVKKDNIKNVFIKLNEKGYLSNEDLIYYFPKIENEIKSKHLDEISIYLGLKIFKNKN